MNFKMVLKSLGALLICEAMAILPSLVVSYIYRDGCHYAFTYTVIFLLILSFILLRMKIHNKRIFMKDGFAIVALGWILISFFGSLPYYLSGATNSLVNCFFEGVSGFTTTGVSVLGDIENLPKSIVFWRSFTHWIGGMGVLVLTLAILPSVGAGTLQIMKAESPGPNPSKLVPKLGKTAKLLYTIYLFLTIILAILLFVFGMPVYDAIIHAFGVVATGGCTNVSNGIADYQSIRIEIIISIFMFICGCNFNLHYQFFKGNLKAHFKDGEFRFYLGLIIISTLLIAINLYTSIFQSMMESLRYSSFQVISILTTTGYNNSNFDKWPMFSKAILYFLMIIGGCAGSTAGGIKGIRILVLIKSIKTELMRIIHPKAIYTIRIGTKVIDEKALSGIKNFFFVYVLIFCISILCVSLDGFDVATTISSVAATISNTGAGFAMLGPIGDYSILSTFSKVILSLSMLLGRLEIYPILLLIMPNFWKRVSI